MPGSVLLVHDDISAIAAARRVLVSEGLEVSLATSCADAFTSYQQRPFNLVVLAPGIEGGLGASVYDEIRSLPSGARVRFVLLGSEIADSRGTVVVDLPLDAEAFRGAVREVLHASPDSKSLPRRMPTASEPEAPTAESPPWGGPAPEAPLAEQLFGRGPTPVPARAGTKAPSTSPGLVMPAVSIGDALEPAPEPYGAVSPDGPTLERELRWDDLNVPSEAVAETGGTPLSISDVRPATVEASPISAARERRVLAELEAGAEIAQRARAVTAPSRMVDREASSAETVLDAELESRRQAERRRSQDALEVQHEAELAATAARIDEERQARVVAEARIAELEAQVAQLVSEQERHRAALEQAEAGRLAEEGQTRAATQSLQESLATSAALEKRVEAEHAARAEAERALEAEHTARGEAEHALEAERAALAEERGASRERDAEQLLAAESRARVVAEQLRELEKSAVQAHTEDEARLAELQTRLDAELSVRATTETERGDEVAARQRAEGQIESLRGELAAQRKAHAALEQQLADAERRAEERAERERLAEREAQSQQEQLSDTERAYQQVEEQLTQLAPARLAAEQRAADLAARRIELEQALEEAEKRARTEAEQIAALEESGEEAEAQLARLAQQRTEAQALVDESAARQGELEVAAASAQDRLAAEMKQLEALAHQRAELEVAAEAQRQQRADSESQTRALAEQGQAMQRSLAAVHEQVETERAHLARLEAAQEQAQTREEAEARATEAAEKEVKVLQAQRQKLAKEAALVTARAQAAATARAELEKVCAELEAELELGAQEREAEEARAAELERRAHLEEERRAGLERSRDEAVAKLESLTLQRTEVEQEVQQTSTQRDALARQAHEASARVQAETARLEELERALAEATRRRDLAQRTGETAARRHTELAEKNAALQREAEAAEQQALAQIERNAELEQARQTAEAQAAEESTRRQAAAEQAEVTAREVAQLEVHAAEAEEKLAKVRAERQEAEAHAEELAQRRAAFAATLARIDRDAVAPSSVPRSRPATEPALELSLPPPPAAPEAEPGTVMVPRVEPREPRPEDTSRRPTAPLRRALRPLAGGRWQRAEVGPAVRLPPEVEAARGPLLGDGPAEARPPTFPTAGKLADLGAARFLARCWADRVTGRFDFDCRDGARALFFEEGRLVAAVSNAPNERLEVLAHRDGLITRAHMRALRPEAERMPARQLAVHLVELRLIKGTELYALVRRQMEEVAYALFADETVDYLYGTDLAPTDLRVALPMTPLAFMVEGVRRKGDFDRLNPELGGPTARVVLVREGAPELVELGLSARERRLVALIDGLRTIEELIFASGLDPQAAMKLLYALQAAGAVETLAVDPVPAQEGTRNELLIDLGRVGEKYDQVQHGDYFEILGVTPEATTYEVRQAFERIIREFHPGRFTAVNDEGLSGRLDEIGRMVAEAADVLSDDVTRREYARNLAGT